MITDQRYDEDNNLVYEEHEDGYIERNTYDDNNHLVRSEQRYANGIIEVENYKF